MRKKILCLLLIMIFTRGLVTFADSPMPTRWYFYVDSPYFLLVDRDLGVIHSYYEILAFAASFGAEVDIELLEEYNIVFITGLHMDGRRVSLIIEADVHDFIIVFGGLDMDEIYDIFVETEQIAVDEDDFRAILEEQGIYWGTDMAIFSGQPQFEGFILPILRDDIFYAPLRFIAMVFGFVVEWQGDLVLLTDR